MFFWGSYNFQEPQQAEHPERPPLRYPAYLPPSLPVLRRSGPDISNSVTPKATSSGSLHTANANSVSSSLLSDATAVQEALRNVRAFRMQVHHIACGAKHLVAAVSVLPATAPAPSSAPVIALYGMGHNEYGQLGHHVADYATTLSHLHLEDVMEGVVVGLACGARHTLVCTSTGCVYVAGDDSSHQLGLPRQMVKTLPKGGLYAPSFTQLSSLAHVKAVFANGNASFALDRRGQVYSWGEAKYGHLGHNDTGERLDTQTLRTVATNVASPQLIRWFERHRVTILEVALGKAHMVCRSEDDIYTCGEPFFGKLGHGDIDPRLEPTRVVFPPRKQTERIVSVAAGDDHTLVLKMNPVIGSVVYFFGKLGSGDGQLQPTIVQLPTTSIRSVIAGRGTFSAALTDGGLLYVWGKHAYPKVYNGTNAAASRAQPSLVQLLERFPIGGVASGGTFVVAYAAADAVLSSLPGLKGEEPDGNDVNTAAPTTQSTQQGWDVVVPHDARVGRDGVGDLAEEYEEGLRALLRQYLGPNLGSAYVAQLPPPPPRTAAPVYKFDHIATSSLTTGQKVRLWMTNVYAIGTIVDDMTKQLLGSPSDLVEAAALSVAGAASSSMTLAETRKDDEGGGEAKISAAVVTAAATSETPIHLSRGKRVKIEWQRDDWKDEVLTLYSDDETLDEANANRWQPFWFECNPDGEYVVPKM